MAATRPNRLKEQANKDGKTVLELVKAAILECGSKEAAARKLGVSRNTIAYHLKRAGIEAEIEQSIRFVPVESQS